MSGAGFSLRKKCLLVIPSEARDLLFSPNPRKSRFLGQTQPFGMTRCGFFRSHFSLRGFGLAKTKTRRLKPARLKPALLKKFSALWATARAASFLPEWHPRPY